MIQQASTFSPSVAVRRKELRSLSRQRFHRISYLEWGDTSSPRVAICVHGLSRQGRDFDRLAESLVDLGYRVVCPDLVGRGASGRLSNADDYALPQYAVDMTMLLARIDVDEVDWVGTSLGGLVGMILGGMADSPIRRLVVNDIGPFIPWRALRRLGDNLLSAPSAFRDRQALEAYIRRVLQPFGDLTDEAWRHLAEHSAVSGRDGSVELHYDRRISEAFRPGRVYNVSMWQYWDAIRCPTLVLRGEKSDLLEPDTAAQMARRGPRARVVEIPNCGHAPALMDSGQIRLITEFLTAGRK